MKQQIVLILLLFCIIACHAPNKQQEKSNNIECPKVDSVVNVDETNLQQKDSLCADGSNKEKWGPWAPINEETEIRGGQAVFEDESGKVVGYLGSEITLDDNKYYYVLDTLTILGHQVILENQVDLSTKYLIKTWSINVKELNDTAEISYGSSIDGGNWEGLYLTKGENGSLKIIKFVDLYTKQIHLDNRCNRICRVNLNETVRGVIELAGFYDRLEKKGRCINCPYKYSYTEALQFLEEGRTKFDEKEYDEEPYDYYGDDDS